MKKVIAIIILICAVAGGGIFYWKKEQAKKEAEAPEIAFAKVERGSISMIVASTGRIVSNLDVEIKCKASGEVIKLPYDVSDRVKKGDLLVELDPVDERRLVKQAEATLSASQARLKQARLDLKIAEENLAHEKRLANEALKSALANAQFTATKLERQKLLFEKKLISREELDAAETSAIQAASDLEQARIQVEELVTKETTLELKKQDVNLAQAQVESDKISLSLSQQRLKDTKVFAPIDGIVSARNVQTGQIISSGITNVSGGTTVMTLSDLSRVFVLASVDESDIGKVELEQSAVINTDAFPEKDFKGKVIRIATKGVNISNVVTFEVKLEVLGKEKYLLKPEMTANVKIIAAEEDDVLLIPIDAVLRRQGKQYAEVLNHDGNTVERFIETGIDNGEKIRVINGLDAGDKIKVQKEDAESRWSNSARKGTLGPGRRMRRR
jgi:HlyD family secretion protein